MNRIASIALLAVITVQLSGCGAYAGYGTPSATLQTLFASARAADYSTTYEAYYQRYHDLVTRDEFVSHRRQASALEAYRIDSLTSRGDSALKPSRVEPEAQGAVTCSEQGLHDTFAVRVLFMEARPLWPASAHRANGALYGPRPAYLIGISRTMANTSPSPQGERSPLSADSCVLHVTQSLPGHSG